MKKSLFFLVLAFQILFLGLQTAFATELLMKLSGPAFINDLRYNSEQNFLKKNIYESFALDACYVHKDLYSALEKLEKSLVSRKLKLVFWDCWRPAAVQEAMWKLMPDPRYVADPKSGSNHNRGIAIDVSLANEDGKLLDMPTPFDDFSAKAASTAPCKVQDKIKCENRNLLIKLMAKVGLKPLPSEWWHFQLPGAYPLIPTLPKP